MSNRGTHREKGTDVETSAGFNWHELMSRDPDMSERFYRAVTGVDVQSVDVDGRDYRLLMVEGRPVAGMTGPAPGREDWPSGGPEGHWVCYFETNDVDSAVEAAVDQGGEVLLPPVDIPGTGRAAVLRDPDGATFGVFAPDSMTDQR
jgi:predicted enzyme related to lactoylglutathione lyase